MSSSSIMRRTDWALYTAILVVFGFAVYVMTAIAHVGLFPNYSDGSRAGLIQKVSRKGLWCKSVEGELVLQSFGSKAANPGAFSDTWQFTVVDEKIVAQLEQAMTSGKITRLTYQQWFVKPMCNDTPYVITKVDVQ